MEVVGSSYDHAQHREHVRDRRGDDEGRAAVHAGRKEYVVQAQELNTRFPQCVFETWIDASRRQTELGQTMAQRLFGKAEEQTNFFQSPLGSWADACAGIFFGPFGYYWEGLENSAHNVTRMPAVTPATAVGAKTASYRSGTTTR